MPKPFYFCFVQLGSTTRLCRELNDQGFRTKVHHRSDNSASGHRFTKSGLYKILHNRRYLGEVRHKDQWYTGQHEAIIDTDLWEAAQRILEQNAIERSNSLILDFKRAIKTSEDNR